MDRNLRSLTATLALAIGAGGSALAAPPDGWTQHPVVSKLVDQGFELDEGLVVKLPPPLINENMTGREQRAAFEKLIGAGQLPDYARQSINAKQRTRVTTDRKLGDQGAVRRLDQHFIVHGTLKLIRDQQMLDGFMAKEKEEAKNQEEEYEGISQYLKSVDGGEEVEAVELGLGEPFLYRYRYPLLNKVVISGMTRGQSFAGEHVLVESAVSAAELLDDPREPTVWRKIPRGADNDQELGPPTPFRGFAGYMQVTELKFLPGAVLVECHGVLIEPTGWFGGRNILAPKLPIVAQQNVRDLRRKVEKFKKAAGK
ncbi:MAG: hypothetical protein AAGJ46_16635 [Planctomycetota bacterium]